jgi:hypothetical protein|tara:strand:- start:46492 stop:46743 length:252 start_codon:yes stop_codon:yes gene_type:complete
MNAILQGKSLSDLHYALGKALEDRPGVLITDQHKRDTDARPLEGLSIDCRVNMGCADRLQAFAAERREELGEERWQQLQAEWE